MIPERLRTKFEVDAATGCWLWTASRTSTGYGRVWSGSRSDWAHRVLYRLLVGEIPDGLVLDHLCRTRHCVNPSHLEPVTDAVNTARGLNAAVTRLRHAAKRQCKRGHPLYGENVRIGTGGRRVCRACHKIHKAAHEARRADVLLELANAS